jgi:hypothetical protein
VLAWKGTARSNTGELLVRLAFVLATALVPNVTPRLARLANATSAGLNRVLGKSGSALLRDTFGVTREHTTWSTDEAANRLKPRVALNLTFLAGDSGAILAIGYRSRTA